jgi:hypothetical protein
MLLFGKEQALLFLLERGFLFVSNSCILLQLYIMTYDTHPRHDSVANQDLNRKENCDISFTTDKVRVVVQQPADAADQERFNSAHRQCVQRMVAVPPANFDCEISGKVSAPRTEVILQRAMLEKLPLLLDISKSTSSKQQAAAQLELPCSVWGFVSLLLLLEGNVKLSHWFRADTDTSLPTQTLLVCTTGFECNYFVHAACTQREFEADVETHACSCELMIEVGEFGCRVGSKELTTIVLAAAGRSSRAYPSSAGVQAAEFFSCTMVQTEIINHLKTLLMELVERTEKTVASAATSTDKHLTPAVYLACTSDWHNVQVCVHALYCPFFSSSECQHR